jgi:hypothetical protein
LLSVALSSLAADFDEDFDVDGVDLTKWRSGFGTNSTATHMQGDADGDQDVDGADFLVWQRQLGLPSTVATDAPVPEPARDFLLIGASLATLLATRSCDL